MDLYPSGWKDAIGRPEPWSIPLLSIYLIIAASVIIAPFLEEGGSIYMGDDGKIGSREHDDLIEDLKSPYARAVYIFGDLYCHQLPERSYGLNGNQMPVCSRDLGVFTGLLLGAIIGMMLSRRFPTWLMLLSLVPMALDGGLQAATSYESFNLLRVGTGLIAGTGVGIWTNRSTAESLRMIFYRGK